MHQALTYRRWCIEILRISAELAECVEKDILTESADENKLGLVLPSLRPIV